MLLYELLIPDLEASGRLEVMTIVSKSGSVHYPKRWLFGYSLANAFIKE